MKWTVAIFESLEERIKLYDSKRQDNSVVLWFSVENVFAIKHKNLVIDILLWNDFLYRVFTFIGLCMVWTIALSFIGIPIADILGFDRKISEAIIFGLMTIIIFLFVLCSFLFHINKYSNAIVFSEKKITSHSVLKRKRILLDYNDIKSVSSVIFPFYKGKYLGYGKYGNSKLTYDTEPYTILIRLKDEKKIEICINRKEKDTLLFFLKQFIDLKINVEIWGPAFHDVSARIKELQR